MITVSIVTYHTPIDQLSKIIDSILNIKNVILFIVDNSSNDSIRCYLPKTEKLKYIISNKNLGFGSAHNIAIEKAILLGSNYHLVVNPDIYFKSGTIETITEFMDSNPDVGLIMPQILYPNGEIQYLPKLLPTPFSIIKRKLLLPRNIYIALNSTYELRFVHKSLIIETPIISGCFSFFRTDVLKKIGYYDDRFFMYFEDFDISRRAMKYGKNIYYPMVSVFHGYERGANKNLKLTKVFLQSAITYFNKWGWFIDKERVAINKATLKKINKEQ